MLTENIHDHIIFISVKALFLLRKYQTTAKVEHKLQQKVWFAYVALNEILQ